MPVRVGINGFGRIGRNFLRAVLDLTRTSRSWRPTTWPHRHQCPPSQVRLHLRRAGPRGEGVRGHHRRRPSQFQGVRRKGSRQYPVGRPGSRRDHRVHRQVHQWRESQGTPGIWGQNGHHLRSRHQRRRHLCGRSQRRQLRPARAQDHLQRQLHDQLLRAHDQSPRRRLRSGKGPNDHCPRLHQ